MNSAEAKQAVLDYIRKNDSVSYAELNWFFENIGFDYKGDLEIYSPVNDMVIFWTGWNEEAIEILNDLKSKGLIEQEPAQPFIYLIDGGALCLPYVRGNYDYKTPHWLPLVFRSVNKGTERGRKH